MRLRLSRNMVLLLSAGGILIPPLLLFVFAFVLPEKNSLHLSDFTISLIGRYFTYAVLALGVAMLWGQCGILSLGQSLFFAIGGYALGMYLLLQIGTRGQYHSPLPDYMVFLGYRDLPFHFRPFRSFPFAIMASMVIPASIALLFGFLAFRARIRGVYFSILTQVLTYVAALLFFRNESTFGGNNGFTDFKDILGHDINAPVVRYILCVTSYVVLVGACLCYGWIRRSRFGLVLRAIRDSENRLLFSGYNTMSYKLLTFVLVAGMTGLAGGFYVAQVGIINPSEMEPAKSMEAVIWAAIGGRESLWGPIAGAIGVNWLKSWATRAFPDHWIYILGLLFLVVPLLLPNGIAGITQWRRRSVQEPWKPVEEGVEKQDEARIA